MRDFAAMRASTSFAEGACCLCDLFRPPQKDVFCEERCCCHRPLRARSMRTTTTTGVRHCRTRDPICGIHPLGKKGPHFLPPPFFFTKENNNNTLFFCERKKKSTTNTRRPQTTTLSRPRNHFELQREDDDHDDDNADLLLFSFFPSLPLVVVDVPLFVERRACE